MKITISAIAALFASSSPLAAAEERSSLGQCFPDDIPRYTYDGSDYNFSRMKYNSVCVDGNGNQYQWGKIEGVWPPIDEPNSGCSSACISGYGRGQARGCTSMKPDKLVGFNYNCDESACYCLYEKNTWSDSDTPCFDSMDTSKHGRGDVFNTQVQRGSTCYSLDVLPTPSPDPPGSSICTYSPDNDCYKSGWPACCSENNGRDCPSFPTMCDNNGRKRGSSYCTHSPEYGCYKSGWPACCHQPGGDIMNCPKDKPSCETDSETTAPSPSPSDQLPGSSICTYSPDNDCYKSGWPACCSENNGRDCPSFPTMCDNNGRKRGSSYCTHSPEYGCYKSGWPACCHQPGGDIMNCPKDKPSCETDSETVVDTVATKFVKSVISSQ